MNDIVFVGQVIRGSSPIKKILKDLTILHQAWEIDNTGWIVELENGERKLILTQHMSPYFADAEELRKKIREYERLVTSYKDAMGMMQKRKEIGVCL